MLVATGAVVVGLDGRLDAIGVVEGAGLPCVGAGAADPGVRGRGHQRRQEARPEVYICHFSGCCQRGTCHGSFPS